LQFALRPANASDDAFLNRLYESTHGQQFVLLALAVTQRRLLVRMQVNAQRTGYRQQYPRSEDFVVVIRDERAGRLWLDESGEKVVVVDIAIAREHQGRGIGRAVLQHVIEKADCAGKSVRLTVDRMNARAFELYRRLGFEVCGGDDVYIEMQSAPGSAPTRSETGRASASTR
jgi:ribosomal protein S18 acetylase RimI-like enzyme